MLPSIGICGGDAKTCIWMPARRDVYKRQYAGCGLPYYVGHVIEEKSSLIVHTPEKYTALTGAHVLTGVEATKVDRARKEVTAVHLDTQETAVYPYDKLVIATGASPIPVSYTHLFTVEEIRSACLSDGERESSILEFLREAPL